MADDANEGSAAMLGSAATGWSEELVSVVADYRIEWRQPAGRQDALELLMRSAGGADRHPFGSMSATAVGKPRLSQPTLTDAEREAVAAARELWIEESQAEHVAATLRGLLERTRN